MSPTNPSMLDNTYKALDIKEQNPKEKRTFEKALAIGKSFSRHFFQFYI